jgi:hypothetical protein
MILNGIDSFAGRQALLGAPSGRQNAACDSLAAQDVLCAGLTWCMEQTQSASGRTPCPIVVREALPVSASVTTQPLFSWRITR